jgi:dihydropyrimidinase
LTPGGTRIIDASGKFLLPGGIDANVHLQMPTDTDGTSVAGGTRTIDDFYQVPTYYKKFTKICEIYL